MFLTRWNYTKEEWRNFLQWRSRRKGFFFYIFQKLKRVKAQDVPEIRITADRVWVNNVHQPFQNRRRQFREINIREAGAVNILEITYEQGTHIRDIRVPIPRGKLRETLQVQERLLIENGSIG